MIKKIKILFFILFINNCVFGQYAAVDNIPFAQYGHIINSPLTGGLSAAQFSEIDINSDGKQDIFVFDRAGSNYFILLNMGGGNFTYAPQYNNSFPVLTDWALLRDYNCDGIPDIFTYYIGSTKVYKGVMTDGVLSFELAKETLIYESVGGGEIALYTSRTDIPSFDDIDNDGDIDVLSFSVSGTTIRLYNNISVESGYGCDSLIYELNEFCWGKIYEGVTCDGGTLNITCKGNDEGSNAFKLHIGSTIVTFDKNGDNVKDAVLGDNSCNNLVYYRNGGSTVSAEMDDKDSTFPKNTLQYNMPIFPAAFIIDADNDGDKDLIATTNDAQLGLNTEHIWWYENLNTNDTFNFVFKMDTFIINQMVDAGAYSKPVFVDYNHDNLLDIVIGVASTYGKDNMFHQGLWLYINTGTADLPSYELVTRDFGNLAQYALDNLIPAFADIDNDGDEDMFCGLIDGTILFQENLSGATGEAVFAPIIYPYQSIDVGAHSAPFFIDVDSDNKLDLVCGEQNGNLNYYHNTGTITDPIFTLENEIWGGVDVRTPGYITGYSVPYLYRNENDSLYLLVGSQSGRIFKYNELEIAPEGEFFEVDTNYLPNIIGTYTSVFVADINNDGTQDFLLGNVRGGLMIFEDGFGTGINNQIAELNLSIYPNPATNQLTINLNGNFNGGASMQIYSSTGTLIISQTLVTSSSNITLPKTMEAGIYFIHISTNTSSASVSFMKN